MGDPREWRVGGLFFEYKGNYFRDGLLFKEFAVKDVLPDAPASDEEKKWFAERRAADPADLFDGASDEAGGEESAGEGEAETRGGARGAKSARRFFKNERVRIISGELKNLEGIIEEADANRRQVHLRVALGDGFETLVLGENEVVKVFRVGDHVKVLEGSFAGETGTVLIADGEGAAGFCVVLSDSGDQQMRVFVNYLTLSVEVSQGLTSAEGFNLYDLVAVGCAESRCLAWLG